MSDHTHAENMLFEVSDDWAARAHVSAEDYEARYAQSIDDPDGFWGEVAGLRH